MWQRPGATIQTKRDTKKDSKSDKVSQLDADYSWQRKYIQIYQGTFYAATGEKPNQTKLAKT